MTVGVSTWPEVYALLVAAKPYARGPLGRQLSKTSKTQSRAKTLNRGLALAKNRAGGIGTRLPRYARTDGDIELDPHYLQVKNLLRDFSNPLGWQDRPDATDHEDVDA